MNAASVLDMTTCLDWSRDCQEIARAGGLERARSMSFGK